MKNLCFALLGLVSFSAFAEEINSGHVYLSTQELQWSVKPDEVDDGPWTSHLNLKSSQFTREFKAHEKSAEEWTIIARNLRQLHSPHRFNVKILETQYAKQCSVQVTMSPGDFSPTVTLVSRWKVPGRCERRTEFPLKCRGREFLIQLGGEWRCYRDTIH